MPSGMATATSSVRSRVMPSARDGSFARRSSSGTASPVTRSLTLVSLPAVDVDAFVAAHQAEWERLDSLSRRRGGLSGPEADELVTLYRRASTHLSTVRSSAPDATAAGPAVGSRGTGAYRDRWISRSGMGRCRPLRHAGIPCRRLSIAAMVGAYGFGVRGGLDAAGLVGRRHALASRRASALPRRSASSSSRTSRTTTRRTRPAPSRRRSGRTTRGSRRALSSSASFSAFPCCSSCVTNAVNVAVCGRADGGPRSAGHLLRTDHTARPAGADGGVHRSRDRAPTGLDGDRPRPTTRGRDALAEQGRAAVGMAIGLTGVLLVSGVIEAFVTPSGLPDLGANRHRRRGPGGLPRLRVDVRTARRPRRRDRRHRRRRPRRRSPHGRLTPLRTPPDAPPSVDHVHHPG